MRLLVAISLLFVAWTACADELQLKTGAVHQGVFLELDQKGRLSFQTFDRDEALNFPMTVISAVTLNKPRSVSFTTSRNKKKTLTALFHGLKDGEFSLQFSGQKKKRRFQQLQIHQLSATFDMREFMLLRQEYREQQAAATENVGRKAEDMLVAGKATVLYFVSTLNDVASRQGSLLKKLCRDHERQAACVEVQLNSLQHQTALVNGLKSLPQFWFYSAEGELAGKLVERFTEDDIEKILQKAIKGKY